MAFLAAMMLLVFIGWLAYRTLEEWQGASEKVTHTYRVIQKLQELLTDIFDAEAGQRDFIITGDEQRLRPYLAAIREADEDLAALKSLTADNPEQQKRLVEIEAVARERLALLEVRIEDRKTGGFPAAQAGIRTGQGMMLMNRIRSRIDEAVAEEMKLLQERSTLLAVKTRKVNETRLAGSILAIFLLGAAFTALDREITRRASVERELESRQAQLHVALDERTQANEELTKQRRELEETNDRLQTEIAERMQIQELLKASNADLQRSNRDLELFASVASHDLQEPLHNITSYTGLLAHRYSGRLDEKADKYIGFIVDGSNRMHRMINDLLSYSRVGTRAKPFIRVRIAAVLDQALFNLGRSLKESNATIERDDLPVVNGDETQLAQLFQNLISNAVKFRKKEVPLLIRVSCVRTGNEWTFGVHDNGIGLEPRFFEQIFEVFRRLHTREEYEGSGIGLAICRRIVEHHGGRLWVESTFGEGSSFYFTIPERGETHGT